MPTDPWFQVPMAGAAVCIVLALVPALIGLCMMVIDKDDGPWCVRWLLASAVLIVTSVVFLVASILGTVL